MHRLLRAGLACAVAALVTAAPASAHEGNPDYQSVFRAVSPAEPGLKIEVLGYDNQYQLINRSGKTVTILGYGGEPYARLMPDGTVEVNMRSPSTYLNEDRFGQVTVPKSANAKFAPSWRVESNTGRFIWHDHRMHWMAKTLPPQVKDKHAKTKIFDYKIPLQVGGRRAAILGTLYWLGQPKGFPVAATVSLILLVAVALGFVLFVRRRRRRGAPADAAGARERDPAAEAW